MIVKACNYLMDDHEEKLTSLIWKRDITKTIEEIKKNVCVNELPACEAVDPEAAIVPPPND